MNKFISFLFLLLISGVSATQSLNEGNWRGVIDYGVEKIPFTINISEGEIFLVNGEERREVPFKIDGDSLTMRMAPFDASIKAKYTSTTMNGYWIKPYRNSKKPFSATYNEPRYELDSDIDYPQIKARWKITLDEKDAAVGIFRQKGKWITGTIMTEVSDYRYFEGKVEGDSINLSAFDGTHAFLFAGRKRGDGWEGKIYYDNNYMDDWTAVYDEEANIQSPFNMVDLKDEKHKPYYDLLGAGSGSNAVNTDLFKEKVVLVQVYGTWCPNSYDQTKYLVENYEEFKNLGVEVISSAFEPNYSEEYGLRRLGEYKADMNIPYQMVLGGRLSKKQAAIPFPFIERIQAFPTLIIVDKQGYVRKVHSYFNGPATGQYFQDFDQELKALLAELTQE